MSPSTRIVGLGQPMAGDDGFGPSVIEVLRGHTDSTVELLLARDTSDLIDSLLQAERTIVVDAVLLDPTRGEREGEVVLLDPGQLDSVADARVSSHGLSLVQAFELARELGATGQVSIVAARIVRPNVPRTELSPLIQAAVPTAVHLITALLAHDHA
jgi:hydrogenase maturation protease